MADKEQLRIIKEEGVEAWNKWRENNPDVEINLDEAELRKAKLSRANLRKARLMNARLTGADLSGADLSGAVLSGNSLTNARLTRADLSGAWLSGANLIDARLTKADLTDAKLMNVRLTGADLIDANLRGAYLRGAQALETDFDGATLTGACIQDWSINSQTNLKNVICDYIYFKGEPNQQRSSYNDPPPKYELSQRRPAKEEKNFEPGEFAKLVEKSIETVDLIFTDGIDWKAFLTSFKDLQVEYGEQNVSIQAIEKKSDEAFVIRLNVPPEADKAEIESRAKESYDNNLKILEAQYLAQLEAKDEQIAIYRQHNTDLLDIIRVKANQPITENHFHGSVGSVDNKGTQTNIAGEVKGNQSS